MKYKFLQIENNSYVYEDGDLFCRAETPEAAEKIVRLLNDGERVEEEKAELRGLLKSALIALQCNPQEFSFTIKAIEEKLND